MANRKTIEHAWRQEFGYVLQSKIDDSGLTKEDVANRIGVTRNILSRYIDGTLAPSIYKTRKIADIIGCTIDDLTKF